MSRSFRIVSIGVSIRFLAALACVASLGLPVPVGAEPAGRFTAAEGDAPVGEERSLEEGETFETGSDGKCALLVDSNIAMEVCGDSAVRLERDPKGRRIVNLSRGRMRMAVEPRPASDRIEIHTPAAVATLLGTIAYVQVDPITGETTITSAESQIRVTSAQPDVQGDIILSPAEQVTMRPGEAPPATPQTLDRASLPSYPGCRVDYRRVALGNDRDEQITRITDRVTERDMTGAMRTFGEFAPYPASPAGSFEPDSPGDDLTDPSGVCVATDCVPPPPVELDQRGVKGDPVQSLGQGATQLQVGR